MKKYFKKIFSNTRFKLELVRDISPSQIKEHRSEMLSLARWICEYFGYKIVKNQPEKVKVIDWNTMGTVKVVGNLNNRIRVDKTWIKKFQGKANRLRNQNPEIYQNRLEGMRCN